MMSTTIRTGRALLSTLSGLSSSALPRDSRRFRFGRILPAIRLVLAACLFAAPSAFAQDAMLTVVVGDQTYVVKGSAVAGKTGREPLDNETIKKARFTGRV